MPFAVNTSGRIYDDCLCLFLLYAHRETSSLTKELSEESDQFRFLWATCLTNLKDSVGLIQNLSEGYYSGVILRVNLVQFIIITVET
jgi:hypothetical protein